MPLTSKFAQKGRSSATATSAGVIRAAIPANTAVLTWARMLAASSSRVP